MDQKECDLNVLAAVSAIAGVAIFLSGAADDCAATLVLNMDVTGQHPFLSFAGGCYCAGRLPKSAGTYCHGNGLG